MMNKCPLILTLLACLSILIPACEVENCPPNSLTYAHFSLVDQHGRAVKYTDTLTVIGQVETADTVINDTLINKEAGVSALSLPLTYADKTKFIIRYNKRSEDVITVEHRNIPYFINLDCGTMMFYEITGMQSTTRVLDSVVVTNRNINNYEKENFKIYFTIPDTNG